MRHSGGGKSAGAGSTTLPIMSLYGVASWGFKLRMVQITNTTTTQFDVKLVRLTTAGTQGSGLVEANYDPASPAQCTLVQTHTVAPTLGDDLGYRATIGAGYGAGTVWVFGDSGIISPVGTANGIGVIVENGTGQIAQISWEWDE